MFFLVARWHQLETGHFAPDSWVALNNLQHSDVWVQYLYSLFHVTGHMISISTGLVNPQRVDDIVATTVSMLIGCALYAGIIGTTASIIQASDPSGAEFYRQVRAARHSLSTHRTLPTRAHACVRRITDVPRAASTGVAVGPTEGFHAAQGRARGATRSFALIL